jgi:hypothetical protein
MIFSTNITAIKLEFKPSETLEELQKAYRPLADKLYAIELSNKSMKDFEKVIWHLQHEKKCGEVESTTFGLLQILIKKLNEELLTLSTIYCPLKTNEYDKTNELLQNEVKKINRYLTKLNQMVFKIYERYEPFTVLVCKISEQILNTADFIHGMLKHSIRNLLDKE